MGAAQRIRLSAFVVSYNRAAILGTCLRALSFADEIIVVDKSSTDDSAGVAARHADRVLNVPWSPTVEETRAFALAQCRGDWILFLDDDECLSPGAIGFIQAELAAPRADIYSLPLRHYVLGVHDERAYYWPERHVRLFRRGAVTFGATVHAGIELHSDRVMEVSAGDGVCIHHLSHPDVSGWIERTNRYTSRPERARVAADDNDLVAFSHGRIEHWLGRTREGGTDGYPEAAALLRAVYDIVDRLKCWEEARGLDGQAAFRDVCADLDAAYPDPRRAHAAGPSPVDETAASLPLSAIAHWPAARPSAAGAGRPPSKEEASGSIGPERLVRTRLVPGWFVPAWRVPAWHVPVWHDPVWLRPGWFGSRRATGSRNPSDGVPAGHRAAPGRGVPLARLAEAFAARACRLAAGLLTTRQACRHPPG